MAANVFTASGLPSMIKTLSAGPGLAGSGIASNDAALATGRSRLNAKLLPWPSTLLNCNLPPMSSTRRWLMARPKPVPPKRRVVELSACENPENIWLWFSPEMPMPESSTENSMLATPACNCFWRNDNTTWPCAVNLMALPPRLTNTWCRRMASPTNRGAMLGSMSNNTEMFLLPTLADSTTARSRKSRSTLNGCASMDNFPASTLEKSRMSLSRPSSERAAPSVLFV